MATTYKGGGCKGEAMSTVGEGDESTVTSGVFPANLAEMVASFPQGQPCPLFPSLRLYRGFWFPERALKILPEVHASFEKRGADILLASFPKSGTTWLKALGFATACRSVLPSPFDSDHPLLSNNSHDCVKFIDTLRFLEDDGGGTAPRLLATHSPYSLLPKRATAADCRIVYITRDPKDTLISLWHFMARVQRTRDEGTQPPTAEFKEVFEQFCHGRCGAGPQWEHAREYWEVSKRRPEHVLCLRYEEMLQDPTGNLKKMAEFMGCSFSAAEEEAGVVSAILELCSLDKQRNLEVNKNGAYRGLMRIDNKHFFRKGVAGDWRNHMTPEMAARLDGIVEEALKGSGFTFGNTN